MMRTYPDFTWAWIIQSCERRCHMLQHGEEFGALPDRIQNYILSDRGIIAIVPKLQKHPQLGKLVPMMSMMNLRWFPAHGIEVNLEYDVDKTEYSVAILDTTNIQIDVIIEQKAVTLDNAADEIYALITQLRDD